MKSIYSLLLVFLAPVLFSASAQAKIELECFAGLVEIRLSEDEKSGVMVQGSFHTGPSTYKIERQERRSEGKYKFARYNYKTEDGKNRYLSISKEVFSGKLVTMAPAYIDNERARCVVTGAAKPEKLRGSELLAAMIIEGGKYFDDLAGEKPWSDYIAEDHSLFEIYKEQVKVYVDKNSSPGEGLTSDYAYLVERDDETVGYVFTFSLCNEEECHSKHALYLDKDGNVVAEKGE